MDFRSLLVALLASGVVALAAQSPAPAFDVVSIKRNVSGSFPVGPEARRGGSFVATNATLVRIVRYAYDLPDYRLAGGPDWVRRDRFDIDARAGRDASSEEIQRMVQSLLRDRFQLVIRQERREGSIYTLVPARNDKRLGPSLHPSSAGCAAPGGPGETIEERLTPNGGVATRRARPCRRWFRVSLARSRARSTTRRLCRACGITSCRTRARDGGTSTLRLSREIQTMPPLFLPLCRSSLG